MRTISSRLQKFCISQCSNPRRRHAALHPASYPLPSEPLLSPGQLCVTATQFIADRQDVREPDMVINSSNTQGSQPQEATGIFPSFAQGILPCDPPDIAFRVAICGDEVGAVGRGLRVLFAHFRTSLLAREKAAQLCQGYQCHGVDT